jgi:predicted PurR-regulated permease PerM
MQSNRWLQTLIILLVIIASAWLAAQAWGFVIQFSNILLLFFLSWLLAFILRPLARWLTTRGLPYGWSVAIVYLALTLALVVGGFLLVPLITQQIQQLITNSGDYATQLETYAQQVQDTLKSWGVKSTDLDKVISDLVSQGQTAVLAVLQNMLPVLQSIATLLFQMIFLFLVSFYFMKDGDRLSAGVLRLLPPRWKDEMKLAALSIERSFGGYIRGQVVFGILYGIVTAFIMTIPPFQLDYVVIASIGAALCMTIPLIGGLIAYIPPVFVAIVTPDKPWVLLLVLLFVIQSVMVNVLGPRILSSAIGLHPIYVVGALMVGGQIAGIWGALFGIPVAGAINLIGRPLLRRLRSQSSLYQDSPSRSLPTSAFITGPLAASMARTQTLTPGDLANATVATSIESPAGLHEPVAAAVSAAPIGAVNMNSTVPSADAHSETPGNLPMSPADYYAEIEQDADEMMRRSPTLSARVGRLVLALGSRAVTWGWTKARGTITRSK